MRLVLPDPELLLPAGRLRPWRDSDAATLAEAWRDPDIVRYNSVPANPSEAAARRWISGCDQRLRAGASLDLAIEQRVPPARRRGEAGARVVGEVGLSGFDDARRAAMIGYWLLPSMRGRGLTTAAVMSVVNWAWTALGLSAIVARCAVENVASQRVAGRSGFVHVQDDAEGNQLWICRPIGG